MALGKGYGIESTSIEHGFVHSTVRAYRVVLFNKEATVWTVDEHTHSELFRALPGSWNTIGLIVAVQMELLRLPSAKDIAVDSDHDGAYWMDIEYRLALDRKTMLETVHSLYGQHSVDSVECFRIDGTDNVFVVAIGTLTASNLIDGDHTENVPVFSMSGWWHHFYHFHVVHEVVDRQRTALVVDREVIELKQFLFRHDRGAFWVIYDDPAMWFLRHFGFMRFLFGYMLTAKDLYRFRYGNRVNMKCSGLMLDA